MTELIRDFVKITFPPRNDRVKASWRPIYIEPLIGSGERLTIGVAVWAENSFIVEQVEALNKLECLYGKANEGLDFAARESLRDLRNRLSHDGPDAFRAWKPPFSGVVFGEARGSKGATLEEIAMGALKMCSSIPISKSDDNIVAAREEVSENRARHQRLLTLVRNYVKDQRPGLCDAFRKRPGKGYRNPVIEFLGSRLAANFAILEPSGLNREITTAKAKILDLQWAREKMAEFGPQQYELLIFISGTQVGPLYSEDKRAALIGSKEVLTEEGNNVGVICRYHESIDAIGQRILEGEVA